MDRFINANLTLPPKLHTSIIKTKNSYICTFYSTYFMYKISFTCSEQLVQFNTQTNTLNIKSKKNSQFLKLFKQYLELLFYAWNFFFCAKFKLKGKGFRIFRKRENKFVKFFFGHSHYKIIKFRTCILLKPHKYKFIVFGNSKNKLNKIIKMVQKIRPIDFFTKRGLRYARQIIIKRKGKSLIF